MLEYTYVFMKDRKLLSLLVIAFIYLVALASGYFFVHFLFYDLNAILKLFIMDVFATFIVYLASVVFKNTSIYDPYWSFVPWVLAIIAVIWFKRFTWPIFIILAALSFWSWRLTINWIITFDDITSEDWRYKKYRESNNRFVFELINFFGLQMMPTCIVFVSFIPFLVMTIQGSNYFALIGAVIILFGALLELIADHEIHQFKKESKEMKTCQLGLWNFSRHPNYLGEISIWFGIAIPAIIQYPTYWYIYPGCILMFLLFYFISIPLMEKRQVTRRDDYKIYQKTTSKLLILPKRKLKEVEENAD